MLQGSFSEAGKNLSKNPDGLFVMKLYFHLPTPPQYTHSIGEEVGKTLSTSFVIVILWKHATVFFSLLHTESYNETLADCRANLRHYQAMNQTKLHRFEDFIRHLVTTVWILELMNLHICGQIFTERKSDRCVDSAPHFNGMYKVSPTEFIKISSISNSDKRAQN